METLFRQYEKAGFLYPTKIKRLAPFWPIVVENWRKAQRAGELILWVATHGDTETREWASISSWLSTPGGWVTQHLVSNGSPLSSRAVMLAGQAVRHTARADTSHQSWFRRENRYANKIFGSAASSLGPSSGWTTDYAYFSLPLTRLDPRSEEINVTDAATGDRAEVIAFLHATRSPVFTQAEGLVDDDLCLDSIDELYRRVGLRRYRRVLIARDHRSTRILGVALAYRGPLGINFSFLENRCDLILQPDLSASNSHSVCQALCASVLHTYADFEPQMVPVVIDRHLAPALVKLGAEHVRDYAQGIWLKEGFEKWYSHTERFYDALLRAGRRRGLGAPRTHLSDL